VRTSALEHTTVTDASANDVLRGTLDLMVLKTLSLEPMHVTQPASHDGVTAVFVTETSWTD
jgi:hypothetical protein